MPNKNIQALLSEVAALIRVQNHYEQKYAPILVPNFQPFELFRIDEPTISKILAFLLDPKANHKQGTLFLNAFCEFVKTQPPLGNSGENNPIKDSDSFSERASVYTELADKENGRLDIVISDNRIGICIENKPWAADQEKQLFRYGKHLTEGGYDNWLLVYLCEHSPSEYSTDNDTDTLAHTVQITFSELCRILTDAAKLVKAAKIRYFIEMFVDYLREYIVGEGQMIDNDTIETIKLNFDAAREISNAYEELLKTSWQHFCNVLRSQCKTKYSDEITFSCSENIYTSNTRCHILFKPKNKDWGISFEKNKRLQNLQNFYWGITVDQKIHRDEKDKIANKMKDLFGESDPREDMWPWWKWGSEEDIENENRDAAYFPRNLDTKKWVEEMQSPDGGELAKIIWDIVDKIMAEVKNETL